MTDFKNKYTITEGEKYTYKDSEGKDVSIDKILVSKDTFAQLDMIDELVEELKKKRLN